MSDFNVDETKKILEGMAAQEKDLSKTMAEMIQTIEEKGQNEKENESFNLIVGLNESEIRVLEKIQEKIEETFKVNFEKLRAIEGKSVSSENAIQKISRDITQLEAMIEDKIKTIRSDQNYLFEATEQQKINFENQKKTAEDQWTGFSESLDEISSKITFISDNLSQIEDNKESISLIKEIKEEINDFFDSYYSELQLIPDQITTLFDELKHSPNFTDTLTKMDEMDGKIEKIKENQQLFSKIEQQYEAIKERIRGHSEDLSKLKKQSNKLLEVFNTESEKFTKDDVDALKNALIDLNHTANSLSKKEEIVQFEEKIMAKLEQTNGSISSVLRAVESNFGTINTNLEKIPERLRENNANFDGVFNEMKNDQEHQKDLLETLKQETSKILTAQKEVSPETLEVLTGTIKPVLEQNKKNENENRELLKVLKEDFCDLKEKQLESQEASKKLSKMSFYLFGFLFANFFGVLLLIILMFIQ